jgi:arylformamidase
VTFPTLLDPIDISIPLRFDGAQPNAYGVEPAFSSACEYGDLVGDTRRGGSCNFESITLIPHCNGTHTECVGHITDERISIRDCLQDVLMTADLISVLPEIGENGDALIDAYHLEIGPADGDALVVRTLPNDDSKLSRVYDEGYMPPYFTEGAMRKMVAAGVRHLLVDMPSIDRLFDDGRLGNHRIFWNVEMGSRSAKADTRRFCTITELIYVPEYVKDGRYLLNLQIPPFESDAAPSRPILFNRVL